MEPENSLNQWLKSWGVDNDLIWVEYIPEKPQRERSFVGFYLFYWLEHYPMPWHMERLGLTYEESLARLKRRFARLPAT